MPAEEPSEQIGLEISHKSATSESADAAASADSYATTVKNSAATAATAKPSEDAQGGSIALTDSYSSAKEATLKPYEWILHPYLDLFFCCGGILWIIFPFHYFVLGENSKSSIAQSMVVIAALGTVLFSQAHVIATLVRVYNDEQTREKFSLYTYWAALLCGTLALLGCMHKELAGVFCKIYLLIVSQHFTAQTYGFALLYCFKRNYRLSNCDKWTLSTLMRSTLWYAVLNQFTYKEWSGDKFLGQKIPFWGPLPEWMVHAAAVCIAVSAIAFIGCITRNFLVEKRIFPLPACLLVLTGVLIFVTGTKMTGVLWIYVPAFFHGSQYLIATTAYYLKEKGLPEGLSTHQIASALASGTALRYLGFLVTAGLALFMGLPQMLAQFGFDQSVAIATIFTTVQFHHVLTDHAIWRMREPRIRNLLVA